jgi:hypothetical protein
MRRGRVVQEFFLDGVLAEPGDGAQPPGDRCAGPALGFQFAGEGLDVGAADREQGYGPGPAPAGELSQVKRVCLPGQTAVPGQAAGPSDERCPHRMTAAEGKPCHDLQLNAVSATTRTCSISPNRHASFS